MADKWSWVPRKVRAAHFLVTKRSVSRTWLEMIVAVTAKTALMSRTPCKTWIPPPRAC